MYAETFGLSLCVACSLSRLFPRRSRGISCFYSVRQVFGCLLRTSWHNTLLAHRCVVLLGTSLYLSSNPSAPCCIREWMTVANRVCLNCLTMRSPNSKVSTPVEVSTSHVIDVPPSAWPVSCSFAGTRRVHRALHLYFVSMVVFVLNGCLLIKTIESRPWTSNMISEYLMS